MEENQGEKINKPGMAQIKAHQTKNKKLTQDNLKIKGEERLSGTTTRAGLQKVAKKTR